MRQEIVVTHVSQGLKLVEWIVVVILTLLLVPGAVNLKKYK